MKRTVWLMMAFVAVFLTACPDTRKVVNFDIDPQVLRGSWNFVLRDTSSNAVVSTQIVIFTSTFVSEREYSVTASVTLESEIYALTGWVFGNEVKFVRPQTSVLPPVSLTLTGQTTGKGYRASLGNVTEFEGSWKLNGGLGRDRADANGNVENYLLEIIRN